MWMKVSAFSKVCIMRSHTVVNSAKQKDASDINCTSPTDCKRQQSVNACGAQALWPCSMNEHVNATIDHGFFYTWWCRKSFYNKQWHFTWFHFQGATVNLNVKPFRCRTAEVFKHAVNSFCDIIRYRFVQLHPAVYHNTAVPEVENFQLLESSQIGL